MGLLDDLMGKEQEAPAKAGLPFNITTSLRPVRLNARKDTCLEVLVVRGKAREVKKIADELIGVKGVKHGKLVMTTAGDELH